MKEMHPSLSIDVYNLICSALLHDIGKLLLKDLDISKKNIKYPHAYYGAIFLRKLGISRDIVYYVETHHTQYKNNIIKAIHLGDTLDAKSRSKDISDKQKEVRDELFGLKLHYKTLHNDDVSSFIEKALQKNSPKPNPESLLSILKEGASLIRADLQTSNINLFVHSQFTAAIAFYEYMNWKPYLLVWIEIDHRFLENKLSGILSKCVEYYAGLEFFSYFGLLGVVTKTLYYKISKYSVPVSLFILHEAPYAIIILIPKEFIDELKNNVKLLSNDIEFPIKIRFFEIIESYKTLALREIDSLWVKPEITQIKLKMYKICDYCGKSSQALYPIERPKPANVCDKCFLLYLSANFILKNKGIVLSIVEGINNNAVLKYPNLNVSVIKSHDYIKNSMLTRLVNPKDANEIVEKPYYTIEFIANAFDKSADFWILIDTKSLIELFLRYGKEWGRQGALTIANLIRVLIDKELYKENIKKYMIFKFDIDGIIIQLFDKTEALHLSKELLKYGFNIVLYRTQNPGVAYKKIHDEISNIREYWNKKIEEKMPLEKLVTLSIIDIGDNDTIGFKASVIDIFEYCMFKKELEAYNVKIEHFVKNIDNIMPLLNNYINAENRVEEIYWFSEIMLKFSNFNKQIIDNIRNKLGMGSKEIMPILYSTRNQISYVRNIKESFKTLCLIAKLDYNYKLNINEDDFNILSEMKKYL
jgi:putative nucleotidyltransferase with HDIG domain